jgi:hypothetical protein
MLFTIGHVRNYEKQLHQYGELVKLEGGYAFETKEDAYSQIISLDKKDVWGVWTMDGNWESDVDFSGDYPTINKDLQITGRLEYG